MYITSSTFLALLSLLLPSMAAPVRSSTASPAPGNEIKWQDYPPFGDESLGVDGRRKYVTHTYEESNDHMGRDTSSQGYDVFTHSLDYRKANIMVPSSESNHRHQEADSHYKIEKDDKRLNDGMQREWSPMPNKRGIVRPRQNAGLTATAPNTPALDAPHKAAQSNHSHGTHEIRPAVSQSVSTSPSPGSLLSIFPMLLPGLGSHLVFNASINNRTIIASQSRRLGARQIVSPD